MEQLVSYTKVHFIYEEMLFQSYNYPKTAADIHHAHHESLSEQVEDFHHRFKTGEVHLTEEVLEFLVSWLNHHIMGSDLAFAEFVRISREHQ